MFWWMRLDLVFLVGQTASSGVFWGVWELLILGSLSANGWVCVPVLVVVWHGVSSTGACWSLSGAGSWHWDGDLWERFRHLILLGAGRSLVDQCPELGSPSWQSMAWQPAEAPRPCQPHGMHVSKWQLSPSGYASWRERYHPCHLYNGHKKISKAAAVPSQSGAVGIVRVGTWPI